MTSANRPLPSVGNRYEASATSQRLAPRQVLPPNERFPKDFWLTPRTVLTRVTPISKLNHFCVRHGAHDRPVPNSRELRRRNHYGVGW